MSYAQNPYGQGPTAEQGYGGQQGGYEMQDVGQAENGVMPQQEFLQRVTAVKGDMSTLNRNVQTIATLHQRSLGETDSGPAARELESLIAETQALNRSIRDQLKVLANDGARTTDGSKTLKDRQVNTLKSDFERELRGYNEQERAYQGRYRDQIARQYRIVNPDASEEEVRQAAEADWGNEGVFQTALRTNRTGQANSVLGNVRARHNELQRIEQTLIELASMFQDLANLVDQQEVAVKQAEENAENTNKWTEEGNTHTGKAIKSARNVRKWKWWCLLVVLLIALILGLVLGLYFKNQNQNNSTPKV